jgi:hypothetical protein
VSQRTDILGSPAVVGYFDGSSNTFSNVSDNEVLANPY